MARTAARAVLLVAAAAAAAAGAAPRRARRLPVVLQAPVAGQPSTANCTWRTFDQLVDHFGGGNQTFKQRYCLYMGFWQPASAVGFTVKRNAPGPIFFYTGNESPVDVYVNNTGLMWEVGERKGALLVFAEHRYEPLSHPCLQGTDNCMSYCTTAQALEDYAVLIKALQAEFGAALAPVVAFGGSYGGMLAGWFRIRYPEVVVGSIAASAPSWGLATTLLSSRLDWSARAISRGVSAAGGATDRCLANMRAAWPLIEQVGKSEVGLRLLREAADLCDDLKDPQELVAWAQACLFQLAEGNYPFASTYITYAVGPGYFPLPPWPLRVACAMGLDKDLGVAFNGSAEEVRYSLQIGDLSVQVDWDKAVGNGAQLTEEQIRASGVLELVRAVRDAASVWYNVTKDQSCYNLSDAPTPAEPSDSTAADARTLGVLPPELSWSDAPCPACPPCAGCPPCPVERCAQGQCQYKEEVSKTFSWDGITCNDDIWLYNTDVQGIGHDVYWPPNVKRGVTIEDIVGPHRGQPGCAAGWAAAGLAGAPREKDPWSAWATAYYSGTNITHVRNIVWSQGLLDPWSGGGVYPAGGGIDGPLRQNISEDGSQVALLIDLGGHHLDLFFSHPDDPPSAREVRRIEEDMLTKWCQEWYDTIPGPSAELHEVVV